MQSLNKDTHIKIDMETLTRFGIDNPMEMIAFLKSPEGLATASVLQKEMRDAQAMLEELRTLHLIKTQQKALLHFLLGLCYQEEKAKKALIAEYNEQLSEEYFEEQAEIMKEQAEEGSDAQEKIIETWSEHIADEYGAVQEGLEDQLGNTEISAHDLEKNWQDFEVLLDEYEHKYPAYTLSMDPLHEKKIIELNGQTYLISAHKNIADLTEEQKNEAQLAYKALSPQLEDRKKIHDQYRSLSIKNNEIQHTMLMLTNQLGKIQGALATIKSNQINPQMSQPLQPQLRPTLSVTSSKAQPVLAKQSRPALTPTLGSTATENPAAKYITLAYRLELLQLKNNPALNQKKMDITQQLKTSGPIPRDAMQFLLQNIGRYNVTLRSQNKGPIAPLRDTFPELKFNPTPFTTRLKPKGAPGE